MAESARLHDDVAALLHRADSRYTATRHDLVTALARAGRPVTLPEIIVAAPELAQSSVYRNLDVLERSGVIQRISVGGDHTHFELAEALLGHHHHLICVECGAIEDIHLDADLERAVDRALSLAANAAGFAPLYHSLDLHGRCVECRRIRL